MSAPYIPAKNALFNNWLLNFATLIAAAPTTYGLTSGDGTAITAVKTAWASAYAAAQNPSTRTPATVAAQDGARANAEAVARPMAMEVRLNASVSDALKIGLGLTIPNVPPTPIPAPTIAPALSLVRAVSLQQVLAYKDPSAVGKAKPFGSIGVQLFSAAGTSFATDPEQCSYQGTFTKSPITVDFDASNQGKKVTHFVRFVTRSGPAGKQQVGPWSDALNLVVM